MNCIAVLLAQFPSITETFILRELKELHDNGYRILILSLKRGVKNKMHFDSRIFLADTVYRPNIFSGEMILSNVYFLLKYPFRYLKTLALLFGQGIGDTVTLLKTIRNFPCAMHFARVIDGNAFHVHAHFAYIPAALAMAIAQILNIPYSFTAHAWDLYVRKTDCYETFRRASFIVTCNEYNRKYLCNLACGAFENKIFKIYHGVDINKFSIAHTHTDTLPEKKKETRKRHAEFNILFVGRLVKKKGLSYLIDACNIIRKNGHEYQCHIVGDGPEKYKLKQRIHDKQLQDFIHLEGEFTEKELIYMYSQADVFVSPSIICDNGDRDGLPNTLIEALAMEIPVVATDVAAIPELIVDGETGLLIPEKSVESLARAIERLIVDTVLRKELGKSGRKEVARSFDIRKNGRLFNDLLNRFVNRQ